MTEHWQGSAQEVPKVLTILCRCSTAHGGAGAGKIYIIKKREKKRCACVCPVVLPIPPAGLWLSVVLQDHGVGEADVRVSL